MNLFIPVKMAEFIFVPIYDEEKQMDLREFFRAYKSKLPQLVIITEGHYGLTNYDDFANDQVLHYSFI